MTIEETVELGRRIEAIERPAAKQRQREGQKRGAEVTNTGLSSFELKPAPGAGQTRDHVAVALGMSPTLYGRAKAIVAACQ